jgi:hypothetical protein
VRSTKHEQIRGRAISIYHPNANRCSRYRGDSKDDDVTMGTGERRDQLQLFMRTATAERAARAEAERVAETWNAGLAARKPAQFSPTIGCAIDAGRPWLRLHCPACRQVYELDLRRIVRPRDFPITALPLVCESGCRRQAPRPEFLGLYAVPEFSISKRGER